MRTGLVDRLQRAIPLAVVDVDRPNFDAMFARERAKLWLLAHRATEGELDADAGGAQHSLDLSGLSQREREVLALALEGRLNKQIAQDLNITMRTVEVHRARALEKMQSRTLIELARLLDPARLREDRSPPGP